MAYKPNLETKYNLRSMLSFLDSLAFSDTNSWIAGGKTFGRRRCIEKTRENRMAGIQYIVLLNFVANAE